MPSTLFLQAAPRSRLDEIGAFLGTFWPILVPIALAMAAIYLLLPRARRYPPLWGGVLAGLALAGGGWLLIRTDTALPETVLFYSFSGLAVLAGGLLLILRNPVHAALAFVLVVLSTCGLFLLQAAPFLMAATIIIYAGAIVVIFLFVIMLAQQEGLSSADQRSREPFLATLAGFILLGALLCVVHRTYTLDPELDELTARAQRALAASSVEEADQILGGHERYVEALRGLPPARTAGRQPTDREKLRDAATLLHLAFAQKEGLVAVKGQLREIVLIRVGHGSLRPDEQRPLSAFSGAPASAPPALDEKTGRVKERMPAYNVSALGRSLFSDYLLAVELAGVLLTVATIGAIVIAGRRPEGLR
ncbi:MAG: NADH-quinone oxidoreductase subunit J [Gemmataceae bacterium]|nr:NADH-quinone oxidoreductase subunit J [Gemmataceae bacterium]